MASSAPVAPLNYRRGLIVSVVAACVMALVGAFRSDALAIGPRLIYWLVIMVTGALIGIGASTGIRHWGRLGRTPFAEGAVVTVLIALPLTFVAMGARLAFFGGSAPPLPEIAGLLAMVAAITGLIIATNYALARSRLPAQAGEALAEPEPPFAVAPSVTPEGAGPEEREPPGVDLAAEPAGRARLLDRLPPHLREAELDAIQAEDHYLRVYTSAGSSLILLRITDAIAELDGVDGARTHRSWWVARAAVQQVQRSKGRAELLLRGGVVAPVSRSILPLLQEQGWLD